MERSITAAAAVQGPRDYFEQSILNNRFIIRLFNWFDSLERDVATGDAQIAYLTWCG